MMADFWLRLRRTNFQESYYRDFLPVIIQNQRHELLKNGNGKVTKAINRSPTS